MAGRVLIVDDDHAMCELVELDLRRRGYDASWSNGAGTALERIEGESWDAVLTDLRMPGLSGIDLCARVQELRPGLPVVVMTAFGSMEAAIDAIRAGAYDFVTKPVELDVLALVIERAVRHRQLSTEVRRLGEQLERLRPRFPALIGDSDAMRAVLDRLEQIAHSEASVLIHGETGTGKELVARALHHNSPRRDGPFVAVNCAALPETLQESELFGHVRGAFTDAHSMHKGLFVQADGGTLFLDEVGEFTPATQAKLLRVLEQRVVRPVGGEHDLPFDVRFIAATNRDLMEAAEEGRFREDLLYRIDVLRVELPPLRDRGNDVLLLAQHFVQEFAERAGKEVTGLAEPVAERLLAYPWPGNVRELRNTIEASVAVTRTSRLVLDDLPPRIRAHRGIHSALDVDRTQILPLAEVERRYVLHVLDLLDGNKALTARRLGLDRKTLYRKLQRWGEG